VIAKKTHGFKSYRNCFKEPDVAKDGLLYGNRSLGQFIHEQEGQFFVQEKTETTFLEMLNKALTDQTFGKDSTRIGFVLTA
jgi:hypothetical protein